jgi:hypothetical protein
MSSFTHINPRPATNKSIIARSKSHSRGIDSDQLYELLQDSQPIATTLKKRKRAQETPTRPKPFLGTTSSSRNTSLSHIYSTENLNSQTATPPDSKTKLLGKTGRLDSEQNRPFPRTATAKPFPRPTSTHWATTEEAVKASKIEVSATTLGRLAAFKFRASSRRQPTSPGEEVNAHPNESVPVILEESVEQPDSYDFDDGLEDEDFLDIDQDHVESYAQPSNNDERSPPLPQTKSVPASEEQRASISTAHLVADEFQIDEEDEIKMMQLPFGELAGARIQSNDVLYSDDHREVYEDSHSKSSISPTKPTYCADEQTGAHNPDLFKESR